MNIRIASIIACAVFLLVGSFVSQLMMFVAGGYMLMSCLAFAFYWRDKRAARLGRWRISENALHMLGFLCGWPGAMLAQHWFRHKTQKSRFKVVFGVTVVANLLLLACLLFYVLSV